MIKAIIFDFFGVVGKSTYRIIHEDFQTTPEQNLQFQELHKAHDYEFISDEVFIKSYAQILGISYQKMQDIYNNAERRFGASQALLDYIAELRNTYKIALLSNISSDSFHHFIEPIKDNFDVVITSYQSKLAKPERAIFELCAQKLGLDVSECLMIDDNYDNCEGARVAGMDAIEYTGLIDLKKQLKNNFNI
jgi:putative hydrolase of the HAD superfamily